MNIRKGIIKRFASAALCAALCFVCVPASVLAAEEADAGQAQSYDNYDAANALADTFIVMDAGTGQVLVSSGPDVVKYPASITKIVTLGLVQQALNEGRFDWDTQVTVTQSAMDALIPDAALSGFIVGEVVSVRDLVYATQIKSANDTANVLAELVGGSIAGFAEMMNAKAQELGLENTNFTNPSGLPDKNHYTTAHDMAALTSWALGVPGFTDIFNAVEYVVAPTNMYNGERGFHSTNSTQFTESDYYIDGILGGKSGYTDSAGYTLVTAAEREGVRLVCVVLRCQNNDDKYVASVELMNYCFENFSPMEYTAGETGPVRVPVYGGGEGKLGEITVYGADASTSFLLHKGLSMSDVGVEFNVPQSYVLGDAFEPTLHLVIGDGTLQTAQGFSFAVTWEGLGEVLSENTRAWVPRAKPSQPVDFTPVMNFFKTLGIVLLAALCGLIVLVTGRVLYVQQRRRKRRERQLLRQREQTVQASPVYHRAPAQPGRGQRVVRNPAANHRRPAVHLQVVGRAAQPLPRAGQR